MANSPVRPGARRPGAAPQQTSSPRSSNGNSLSQEQVDKLRNLPAVEEGAEGLDIDPSNSYQSASSLMQIVEAKYRLVDWKKKDGSYATNSDGEAIPPIIALEVRVQKSTRQFDTITYKFGSPEQFGVLADGSKPTPRASAKKIGKDGKALPPRPKSNAPAVLFVDSLLKACAAADSGATNVTAAAINKDGIGIIAGLMIDATYQRRDNMHANANDVLLVNSVAGFKPIPQRPATGGAGGGGSTTTSTTTTSSRSSRKGEQAQAAAAASEGNSSAVAELATQALTDVLNSQSGKTIARAQIPTTLIKIEGWKNHAQRGEILKALRTEDFLNEQDGVLWTLAKNDGGEITSVSLL